MRLEDFKALSLPVACEELGVDNSDGEGENDSLMCWVLGGCRAWLVLVALSVS